MNPLANLLSIIPLLAFSCSVTQRVEMPQPEQPASVENALPAPLEQVLPSMFQPVLPPCWPLPSQRWQCTNGEGNTLCAPMVGAVYIWDSAAGCQHYIHGWAPVPYDCLDTGILDSPDAILTLTRSNACYARNFANNRQEILLSEVRNDDDLVESAGWHQIDEDLCRSIAFAPECP